MSWPFISKSRSLHLTSVTPVEKCFTKNVKWLRTTDRLIWSSPLLVKFAASKWRTHSVFKITWNNTMEAEKWLSGSAKYATRPINVSNQVKKLAKNGTWSRTRKSNTSVTSVTESIENWPTCNAILMLITTGSINTSASGVKWYVSLSFAYLTKCWVIPIPRSFATTSAASCGPSRW